MGLIAKFVGEMDGIGYVGVDVRLNDEPRRKFQPGVAGFRDADGVRDNQPIMFVDFESPNSSDGRIRGYHCSFLTGRGSGNGDTLRDRYVPARRTGCRALLGAALHREGYCIADHKGKLKEICANFIPLLDDRLEKRTGGRSDLLAVFFLNIDRRKIVRLHVLQPHSGSTFMSFSHSGSR